MPAVQRKGDANAAGGVATNGVSSVRVNGRPILVPGMPVTGHGKGKHAGPQTAGGSATVRAGGRPVIRTGDADTCGHPRVGGSGDVRAG